MSEHNAREHELAAAFEANMDRDDPDWHAYTPVRALLAAYRAELTGKVVAWLRTLSPALSPHDAAKMLERGEHLP